MYKEKKFKRFYRKGELYFITTLTKNRHSYFKESVFCEMLCFEIHLAEQLKEFTTYAYVIMPEHLHILIQPCGEYNISKIMQAVKRNSSRSINRLLHKEPIRRIYDFNVDIDSTGKVIIKKIEEKLEGLTYKFHSEYNDDEILSIPHFSWHKSFHDHRLRENEEVGDYYEYILYNPVKEGLVKDPHDYPWIFIRESDDFRTPSVR